MDDEEDAGGLVRIQDFLSVWRPAPVEEEPEVILQSWRIVLVTSKLWKEQTLHLVGQCTHPWEGRVSSALVALDVTTRCAKTESGRVYKLVGTPGISSDAEYVWNVWIARNKVTSWVPIELETLKGALP